MRAAVGSPDEALDFLRACSACAGDYEDPERTTEDEEGSDDSEFELTQNTKPSHAHDFPVSP